MLFKSKEVKESFLRWANIWDGNPQETHPLDNSLFYAFALKVFINEDIHKIDKEEFVRFAKKHINTTAHHNKGLVQRYYERLVIINEFLQDATKKQLITISHE